MGHEITEATRELRAYKTVDEFLVDWTQDTVFFTTCNSGNAALAANLARSCRANSIPLVFFAADQEAFHQLKPFCHVVDFAGESPYKFAISRKTRYRSSKIGTRAFHGLAWMRYGLLKGILSSGRKAVYLDTDIVIRVDFRDDLFSYFSSNSQLHGVVQSNGGGACTGFQAYHERASRIFSDIFSEHFLNLNNYKSMGALADQEFFNTVVCNPAKEHLLNVHFLSRDLYPQGSWFYAHSDRIASSCKIVHYNGIAGQKNKIEKMKMYGHWSG